MNKTTKILSAVLLGLLVIGCSNAPIVGPNSSTSDPAVGKLATSGDPALVSATFHIYLDYASGQRVDAHRITSDWDEMVVTWNNFGAAYDPAIVGSFTADGTGWRTIDLTSLVSQWMNGTYPNYGILLDQEVLDYPRTNYYSRENTDPVGRAAYLELCFSDGCDTVITEADTYIYENEPDSNLGSNIWLWTGKYADLQPEKQALLKFEIPTTPPPQEGCTHTIGYWKKRSCCWHGHDVVGPLLPIWLGTPGGHKSMLIDTKRKACAVFVMQFFGAPSNGITKLYAQLLAAKLNIAAGADGSDVSAVIAAADAFLATHNHLSWWSLSPSQKQMVLGWKTTLDDYNNGRIGPGHCDEGGCGGH